MALIDRLKSFSRRTRPFSRKPATDYQANECGDYPGDSGKPILPPRVPPRREVSQQPTHEHPPHRPPPVAPKGVSPLAPRPQIFPPTAPERPPERPPQTPPQRPTEHPPIIIPPQRPAHGPLPTPPVRPPGRPPQSILELSKEPAQQTSPGRPQTPPPRPAHGPLPTPPPRPAHGPLPTPPPRPPGRPQKNTLELSQQPAQQISPGRPLSRPPERFIETPSGHPLEHALQAPPDGLPERDYKKTPVRPKSFLQQPSPESFQQSPFERSAFRGPHSPSPRFSYSPQGVDSNRSPKLYPEGQPEASVPSDPSSYFKTNMVVNLTSVNFDEFIKRYEKALIMFFHSRQQESILPSREFAKAADSPRKGNHAFAGVDCAVEKELCCREQANRLPIFRLYSNGFDVSTIRHGQNFNAYQMHTMIKMAPVLTQPRLNVGIDKWQPSP